jgi:hypothetical protein
MAHIDILMVADAEGILKQYGQPGSTSAPTTGPGSVQQPQVVDGSFVFFITKKGDAYANNGNWQLDVSTGTETESAVDIIRWRWIALDLGHKFDCPITGFDFNPNGPGKVETPLLRHYSTTLVVTDPTDATKPVVQKGIDRCWESRAVRDGTIGYNVMFMVVDQEGNVRMHTQIDPYFVISG